MKVFVLGHQQFESAHLLRPWLSQSNFVYGMDFYGEPSFLAPVLGPEALKIESHLIEHLTFDLLKETLSEIQPDLIFHLMQSSHHKENLRDYHLHYKKNIESSLILFQALETLSMRPKFVGVQVSDRVNGQDLHSLSHLHRSQLCDLVKVPCLKKITFGGLVGDGDLRENSLFYQMLQSFFKQERFVIRKPHSVRSFESAAKVAHYLFRAIQTELNPSKSQNQQQSTNPWFLGPESSDMISVRDAAQIFTTELGFNHLLEFYKENRGQSFQPSPDCQEFYQRFETLDFKEEPAAAIQSLARWYRQYFDLES